MELNYNLLHCPCCMPKNQNDRMTIHFGDFRVLYNFVLLLHRFGNITESLTPDLE